MNTSEIFNNLQASFSSTVNWVKGESSIKGTAKSKDLNLESLVGKIKATYSNVEVKIDNEVTPGTPQIIVTFKPGEKPGQVQPQVTKKPEGDRKVEGELKVAKESGVKEISKEAAEKFPPLLENETLLDFFVEEYRDLYEGPEEGQKFAQTMGSSEKTIYVTNPSERLKALFPVFSGISDVSLLSCEPVGWDKESSSYIFMTRVLTKQGKDSVSYFTVPVNTLRQVADKPVKSKTVFADFLETQKLVFDISKDEKLRVNLFKKLFPNEAYESPPSSILIAYKTGLGGDPEEIEACYFSVVFAFKDEPKMIDLPCSTLRQIAEDIKKK